MNAILYKLEQSPANIIVGVIWLVYKIIEDLLKELL